MPEIIELELPSFRDLAEKLKIPLDPDTVFFVTSCGHYEFRISRSWLSGHRIEESDVPHLRRCARESWALYLRATERLKKARARIEELESRA